MTNARVAAGLLLVALAFGLGEVAMSGALAVVDVPVLQRLSLNEGSSAWLVATTRFVTAFGYVGARSGAVIVVLALLLARARWRSALVFLATIAAAIASYTWAKAFFARPRPHLEPWLDTPTLLSYPSGHAAASMVVLLTAALFFDRWRVTGLAVMLSLAIGLTRPMLGVHWPSDVVGGWLWGAGFALIGAGAAQALGLLDARRDRTG